MDKKSVIKNIKQFFSAPEVEEDTQIFVDIKTEEGKILRVSDMKEEATITEITEDGEIEVEDGTYTTDYGLTLVVEGGKIKSIIEKEDEEELVDEVVEEVVQEMANVMRNDGVAIYYEGTELVEGTPLFLDEAMTEPAPDGPHELEGGLKIVIEGGLLKSVEEVMEKKDDPKMEEVFNQINSLKDELQKLKTENSELKSRFNKFADQPSEQPIKEKISFNKINREDKLKFFSKK